MLVAELHRLGVRRTLFSDQHLAINRRPICYSWEMFFCLCEASGLINVLLPSYDNVVKNQRNYKELDSQLSRYKSVTGKICPLLEGRVSRSAETRLMLESLLQVVCSSVAWWKRQELFHARP
jgi:hypothetical protein